MQQYNSDVMNASDTGNVLPTGNSAGQSTAGDGAKSKGLIPTIHVQACRFFFRGPDYEKLGQFYKNGELDMPKAKEEMQSSEAYKLIMQTIHIYGQTLGINAAGPQNAQDPTMLLMEALECRQLMQALTVYQRETQGMYQAENTMQSAVDGAVDSLVNNQTPGLYPFSSSRSLLTKHSRQPNESYRQPITGEFKMTLRDKQKIKPFRPINYA